MFKEEKLLGHKPYGQRALTLAMVALCSLFLSCRMIQGKDETNNRSDRGGGAEEEFKSETKSGLPSIEDLDGVEIAGGAEIANDVTGAYLYLPEGIVPASESIAGHSQFFFSPVVANHHFG